MVDHERRGRAEMHSGESTEPVTADHHEVSIRRSIEKREGWTNLDDVRLKIQSDERISH